MGSYRLYVTAIMVMACIALQEVSSGKSTAKQIVAAKPEMIEDVEEIEPEMTEDDKNANDDYYEYDDSATMAENGGPDADEEPEASDEENHHDCDEYTYKIWDQVFEKSEAMMLAQMSLASAEQMAANGACSDTIRSVLYTAKALITSNYAHYTAHMFAKMVLAITKRLDGAPEKLTETKDVYNAIINDPNINELVVFTAKRTLELLKNPEVRDRLMNIMKAVSALAKPSQQEVNVRNKIGKFKNILK